MARLGVGCGLHVLLLAALSVCAAGSVIILPVLSTQSVVAEVIQLSGQRRSLTQTAGGSCPVPPGFVLYSGQDGGRHEYAGCFVLNAQTVAGIAAQCVASPPCLGFNLYHNGNGPAAFCLQSNVTYPLISSDNYDGPCMGTYARSSSCPVPPGFVLYRGLDGGRHEYAGCSAVNSQTVADIAAACVKSPPCLGFNLYQNTDNPPAFCLQSNVTYPLNSYPSDKGPCMGTYARSSGCAAPTGYTLQQSMDSYGNDIVPCAYLGSKTTDDIAALCSAQPGCLAFILTNLNGTSGVLPGYCIKHVVNYPLTSATYMPLACQGIYLRDGQPPCLPAAWNYETFAGMDLSSFDIVCDNVNGRTVADIASLCDDSSTCLSFSLYSLASQTSYCLKTQAPDSTHLVTDNPVFNMAYPCLGLYSYRRPSSAACLQPASFLFQQSMDIPVQRTGSSCNNVSESTTENIAALCWKQLTCVAFVVYQAPGGSLMYCLYTSLSYPLFKHTATDMALPCQGIFIKARGVQPYSSRPVPGGFPPYGSRPPPDFRCLFSSDDFLLRPAMDAKTWSPIVVGSVADRTPEDVAVLCLAQLTCIAFALYVDTTSGIPSYRLLSRATYPLINATTTYMTLPCQGIYTKPSPTYVLGPWDINPWGPTIKAAVGSFVDPTASWIWSTPGAESTVASALGTVILDETCYNTLATSRAATLTFISDDNSTTFHNGLFLVSDAGGGWNRTPTTVPLMLTPGTNAITFTVTNILSSSGLLYAVMDAASGQLICHSDANNPPLQGVLPAPTGGYKRTQGFDSVGSDISCSSTYSTLYTAQHVATLCDAQLGCVAFTVIPFAYCLKSALNAQLTDNTDVAAWSKAFAGLYVQEVPPQPPLPPPLLAILSPPPLLAILGPSIPETIPPPPKGLPSTGSLPDSPTTLSSGQNPSIGAMVGGVVGGIGGASLLAAMLWWCWAKQRRYRSQEEEAGHELSPPKLVPQQFLAATSGDGKEGQAVHVPNLGHAETWTSSTPSISSSSGHISNWLAAKRHRSSNPSQMSLGSQAPSSAMETGPGEAHHLGSIGIDELCEVIESQGIDGARSRTSGPQPLGSISIEVSSVDSPWMCRARSGATSVGTVGMEISPGLGMALVVSKGSPAVTRCSRTDMGGIAGLVKTDPFITQVAPYFKWCISLPPGAIAVEEGVSSQMLSTTINSSAIQLSAHEVAEQLELVAGGLLDKGGTAYVFKCRWPARFGEQGLLAAKVMRGSQTDSGLDAQFEAFKYEAEVLASVMSPFVVRLYGYCVEPPAMCLLLELLPGTLSNRLYDSPSVQQPSRLSQPSTHSSSGSDGPRKLPGRAPVAGALQQVVLPPLTAVEVLKLAADIACGLAFLHGTVLDASGAGSRIIHRDLKPANILLNSQGQAKISDLGLARMHAKTTVVTEHIAAGTLRYMAPELLQSSTISISNKVDIYSLGVLIWELVAQHMPWKGNLDAQIPLLVVSGARPSVVPPSVPPPGHTRADGGCSMSLFKEMPQLAMIIKSCWQDKPHRRPTAIKVHEQLLRLLAELQKSPQPATLELPNSTPKTLQ